MAFSTDLQLPRDQAPVFPARCIRCDEAPTTTYGVTTHSIGWWSALLVAGRKHRVEVPACAACVGGLRRQRRVRFVIMMGFLIAGVLLAMRLLHVGAGIAGRWIVGVIAIAACMPWFAWELFCPPAVD